MRTLRVSLTIIGLVQLFFGLLFLAVPGLAAVALHLTPAAPAWVNWLFAMMGARFIGYGFGMFVAARAPHERVAWINSMIAIQAVDWLATLGYLVTGTLTLGQVTTAAFLPPLFIAALVLAHPRRLRSSVRTV